MTSVTMRANLRSETGEDGNQTLSNQIPGRAHSRRRGVNDDEAGGDKDTGKGMRRLGLRMRMGVAGAPQPSMLPPALVSRWDDGDSESGTCMGLVELGTGTKCGR